MATSGPGATNLLTGIGNCFFDSVPAIFITGQVNINEQKGDSLTRQIGFQETDIVSMARPVTKAAYAIQTAKEIPFIFEEAYQIATSGRPGPVLIDIPMNIQHEEIDVPELEVTDSVSEEDSITQLTFFQSYINALKNSKRPLILMGRGIRTSGIVNQFQKFLLKYQVPVAALFWVLMFCLSTILNILV